MSITPAGRKVFILQYRTNAGERGKPALSQYGELTVDEVRSLAPEWLAQVRRSGDPANLAERGGTGAVDEPGLHHTARDRRRWPGTIKRFNEPKLQRQRHLLIGRLQHLQQRGLANEVQSGSWTIHVDA